ncbi:MAG: exopolysaccharide biosynthesis protein [Bdellovibrionales bacterium]
MTVQSVDTPRPISEILIALKDQVPEEKVCTFDLLEALHERGFGFLLFIFALPAALPLPGLGVNVIIALPLLFLTAQQALGRQQIWIPEKMKYKSINRSMFESMVDKAIPFVKKIEFFVRPRFGFITHGIFSNIIGLLGLIMALSICVPLPLTNTIPAFGIALMAVGVIMRDGLAVIAGALIGTAWVFFIFFMLIFFGTEGIVLVKETIKGLI